ncbi:Protein of unknown function [Gryllus bimaculatus]|nr:Protein of unknown function [Gryllus bimaculatus]
MASCPVVLEWSSHETVEIGAAVLIMAFLPLALKYLVPQITGNLMKPIGKSTKS